MKQLVFSRFSALLRFVTSQIYKYKFGSVVNRSYGLESIAFWPIWAYLIGVGNEAKMAAAPTPAPGSYLEQLLACQASVEPSLVGAGAPPTATGDAAVGAAAKLWFVRDDHTTPEQQLKLAADLPKFAGGALWLEFFYEKQLAAVRAAFATEGTDDDAVALARVMDAVMENGWSEEFNKSLVDLLVVANANRISLHALDEPAWSLDAFVAKHGRFRGKLKYLANRASQEDDGEGSTSRWAKKILEARGEDTAAAVIVMGGAEHGPVMVEIAPGFKFMYEDFGAVKKAAAEKIAKELQTAKDDKAPDDDDEDDDDDEGKIASMLKLLW